MVFCWEFPHTWDHAIGCLIWTGDGIISDWWTIEEFSSACRRPRRYHLLSWKNHQFWLVTTPETSLNSEVIDRGSLFLVIGIPVFACRYVHPNTIIQPFMYNVDILFIFLSLSIYIYTYTHRCISMNILRQFVLCIHTRWPPSFVCWFIDPPNYSENHHTPNT